MLGVPIQTLFRRKPQRPQPTLQDMLASVEKAALIRGDTQAVHRVREAAKVITTEAMKGRAA
ncbi:hypothetical protein Q0812_13280 [Brevundimonas sp. 2R-24]|uniref:Transcriptional regulator n=1 Tax=Peiella sedimenti TaxID=3061083 RepID=A0ABT8SPS7_9CAUL|nr:hypothetical protein [Caulobacteraceae bacterium XZ-24]